MNKILELRWFWPVTIMVAVLAIYLPGLNAELIFDDQRLMDGTVFSRYGALWPLQERLISFGSFVWIQTIFGEGWWKQRLVNLVLHGAVAILVYYWVKGLLARILLPAGCDSPGASLPTTGLAAGLGALLFAVNPVSVYAVGYLIQRSILMATLFAMLMLMATQRAAEKRQATWLIFALAAYGLALLSKEHAVMLPLVALATYLLVRQPGRLQVALSVAGAFAVVAASAVFLLQRYESFIFLGRAFDSYGAAYLQQLATLSPEIETRAYLLSIINQAWLYLGYAALWFAPNVWWMSLDLRPAFPLGLFSFPQILGVPVYLGLIGGSLYFMVRYTNWRRWAGFAAFAPAVLFATEFATIWIQDPFVLYRSYLWAAVGFPLAVALIVMNREPRTVLIGSLLVTVLFSGLAIERVLSMKTEQAAWADAARKVDLKAPPNAVGRWRPLLNRGNQYLQKGMFGPALDDYIYARSFGEPNGLADYHRGVALQQLGRLPEALDAYQQAEKLIARNPNPHQVYLQKGMLLAQLGRLDESIAALDQAIPMLKDAEERQLAMKTRAQSNIKLRRNAAAIEDYQKLVDMEPANRAYRMQLAMAIHRDGKGAEAVGMLDRLLADKDGADIRSARALMFFEQGRKAAALAEASAALQLKPGDPALQGLLRKIESGG